jgi:KaiC/GvpD/RAD55 family RecA-like ATPase
MQAKGELLINIEPIIFPKDFDPDFIVLDSLTAIASAFVEKEESYRIYIEQLFRFFEKSRATTFLITETEQVPHIYSTRGVEEFLADGVIVLYNIKSGNVRERAIEVLKMRRAQHLTKIVAMTIGTKGVQIYPDQEVIESE